MQSRTPSRAHDAGAFRGPTLPLRRRPTSGRRGHRSLLAHAPRRTGIDEILRKARSHLSRLTAVEAARLLDEGRIVMVDTRPVGQRLADGEIPGAIVIDRNVLEWRLDPASGSRLPIARYGLPVVILCNQGYSSSLAAATLRDLGVTRATDVVGGFTAWRAAGLPVSRLVETGGGARAVETGGGPRAAEPRAAARADAAAAAATGDIRHA